MSDTLAALEHMTAAGTIVDLPYQWQSSDDWKDSVMRPKTQSDPSTSAHSDNRVERYGTPQYQNDEDQRMADPACPTCVFLEAME